MRMSLFLVAACGGAAPHANPAPPPPPCSAVANQAVAVFEHDSAAMRSGGHPDFRKIVHDAFATRCQADGWSAAVRACIVDATSRGALDACSQELEPAQAAALAKAFDSEPIGELSLPPSKSSLAITLHGDGQIEVDGKPVTEAELQVALRTAYVKDKDTQVTIVADDVPEDVRYVDLVHVMDLASAAGLMNVGVSH
jgi:biopolymer transport protein ExbD